MSKRKKTKQPSKPKPTHRAKAGWVVAAVLLPAVVAIAGAWYATQGRGSDATPDNAPSSTVTSDATPAPDSPRVLSIPATNVVFFLIDTLRADRLGTYGYHEHETSPFIDQVAAHGVVFE
ncbi:MAG: hypothetical protein JXO22_14770, partial [Phycisphaerae bacterium]|nr:hypothetical protein [Phycisphaerae bacterium]